MAKIYQSEDETLISIISKEWACIDSRIVDIYVDNKFDVIEKTDETMKVTFPLGQKLDLIDDMMNLIDAYFSRFYDNTFTMKYHKRHLKKEFIMLYRMYSWRENSPQVKRKVRNILRDEIRLRNAQMILR